MGQLRDRAGLAVEALAELRVRGQRGRQNLDGDRPALNDIAVDLAAASAGFRRSLPAGVVKALGHDTHPVDIERAMKNDYSADARTCNLQLEAKAHVAVQRWNRRRPHEEAWGTARF